MRAVYVHGGVSARALPHYDLSPAVTMGIEGAIAVDIVEAAVRVLEDDPRLNAGAGSVLTRDGKLELDAGIADGSKRAFGAVANVQVRYPISLARRVLEETPHVLVTGAGAIALGSDMETIEPTADQIERWRSARDAGGLDLDRFGDPAEVDTVGAVAIDDAGRLAAGSSTGGVFGKMRGRVGDSPIFGAGTYASETVAVVGTGIGEAFIETLAAARVAYLVEQGLHPQRACEEVINHLEERRSVEAGLLALDRRGRVGAAYWGRSWSVAGPEGAMRPAPRGRS